MAPRSTSTAAFLPSNFWSNQFRQWHWISSALILALMLLFAVTGLTLNNPDWFEGEPVTETRDIELSAQLNDALLSHESETALGAELAAELANETGVSISSDAAPVIEYEEALFDLSGPGVDASLTVDLTSNIAFYERIDNGIIAKLNDLHKGRDTGFVWGLLIDITAIVSCIFCISGLGLLVLNAKARASTWPLTSLGLIVPLIAYILFVHS